MEKLRYIVSAFVLCLMVFSCQEKEQETGQDKTEQTPVFPEKVIDLTIVAGQDLEFTFTPNMDWELSIGKESLQFFKLVAANGRQGEKVSGKASEEPVTVSIWVNPLEEYGTNRSCTVTMTMGGKSQVVAEYMRPAKQKSISIYAAKVENGVFVKNDAGEYVYDEAESQTLAVMWSEEDAEFIMPVKIVSNCQWDIDRTSFPTWLQLQVPEKTEGNLQLVLKGVSLDDVDGDVSFVSGDAVLKQLSVSVPSCRGIDVYYAGFEEGQWIYGENGYEYSTEPQDSISLVWTGSDFRLPVKVDSKCEWTVTCPDWAAVEFAEDDDRRSGSDFFTIKADPEKYPLDDISAKMSFAYKGEVLKEVKLCMPGCRDMITYAFGMSITELEFNFGGQYKTSSGYMDAPIKGTVTAPSTMVHRVVEIKDGKFLETVPDWLSYDVYVDQDTDTKIVLQNKAIEVSVEENPDTTDRSAYIFLLPAAVSEISSLFEDDELTVKEDYLAYCIPVLQKGYPADYLTPEFSISEMDANGASIKRSEHADLYTAFGDTRYAYDIEYKNVWSDEGANVYLTSPCDTVYFYDSEKNQVTDVENFWLTFTCHSENKDYGAFEIKADAADLQPATAYAVFKDVDGNTMCAVHFSYAPVIPEEPEIPEIPVVGENVILEDASHYFENPEDAEAAGASLELVKGVYVPMKPLKYPEPVKPGSDASEEEMLAYQDSLAAWQEYRQNLAAYEAFEALDADRKAFLRNLSKSFKNCQGDGGQMLKLTYKDSKTVVGLDFDGLKGKKVMFSVNPSSVSDCYSVDNKWQNDGGKLGASYDGTPRIKMSHPDADSVGADNIKTIPVVILFHDEDNEEKILLAVYCELLK